MFIIILTCFFKFLWIIIDPFILEGKLTRGAERVMAELIYSFLYTVFAIVLMVWYTLYEEIYDVLNAIDI